MTETYSAFNFEKYQGVALRAVGQKGAGRASYRNLLSSGVNAAVQAADIRGHRLGHAMGTAANAPGKPRSVAGVSTVNARIFESSYTAISGYVHWVSALARMVRGTLAVGGSVPLISATEPVGRPDAPSDDETEGVDDADELESMLAAAPRIGGHSMKSRSGVGASSQPGTGAGTRRPSAVAR